MDIRKLQIVVVDALEDVKAQDIRVFNTTGLSDLFDRVVVASGTSNRQTKALAASVRDKVKKGGGEIVSMEGEETGEWVLVDLGDMIVHIMQPTIRAYYNLEELWGSKPMALKAKESSTSVVGKAKPKSVAKKAPAKKAAASAEPVSAAKKAARAPAKAPRKTPAKRVTRTASAKTATPAARKRKPLA